MNKIKILVVPSDRTGVSKFRSVDPHLKIEELYSDDFRIDIDYNPKIDDDNFFKNYQIIHFHRTLGPYEQMERLMGRLKKLGIITIMDLDDYWIPMREHPAYPMIIKQELPKKIIENLKLSQYITTTTEFFANEIKNYNKNVTVFPNAIDPNEKQFQIDNSEKSDRVRIGWLGGSSHLADLKILDGVVNKLNSAKYLDKIQFVICGFDLRGEISQMDPKTRKVTKRAIRPEETSWYFYEEIFTDKYKIIEDPKYLKYLKKYIEEPYDTKNQPYCRVWTKPVTTYATNYNVFDISLAPLKEHIFNKVKSQLKVIEAGFYKKSIIAQDYGPYTIDIKNAFENGKFISGGNGLLVPSIKNHKQWFKYIKLLIDNPNFRLDIGEQLYTDIYPKYNMEKISRDRAEWYKQIINI